MKFADLAANLDQMEATKQPQRAGPHPVRGVPGLFGGRARADHLPDPGPARALLRAGRDRPRREAAHHRRSPPPTALRRTRSAKLNRQTGDLGVTAQRLAPAAHAPVAVGGRGASAPVGHRRRERRRAASRRSSTIFTGLLARPRCHLGQAPGAHHARQDAAGHRRPDRARRAVVREEGRPLAAAGPGGAPTTAPPTSASSRGRSGTSGEAGLEALKVTAGHPLRPSSPSAFRTRRR